MLSQQAISTERCHQKGRVMTEKSSGSTPLTPPLNKQWVFDELVLPTEGNITGLSAPTK